MRYNVYCSAESLAAEQSSCCAFKNLNSLYVVGRNGEICCKVAGMRIINAYSVQQNSDLVESSAVDTDVRLNSKTAALPDIHTDG